MLVDLAPDLSVPFTLISLVGAHLNLLLTIHFLIDSGYDFGYFVKLLSAISLPTTEEAFFDLLRIWFPIVYDIKFMMRACKVLKGGLQDVADDLGVGLRFVHLSIYINVTWLIGNAHRTVTSSWLRFITDGLHFFQNARNLLQ